MAIKVEVLGGPEEIGSKGQLCQPIAIFYPGKRYPTEDKMFLADGRRGPADEAVRPGTYLVDVHELVYPDQKNFGRLAVSGIKPKNLKPVARTATA